MDDWTREGAQARRQNPAQSAPRSAATETVIYATIVPAAIVPEMELANAGSPLPKHSENVIDEQRIKGRGTAKVRHETAHERKMESVAVLAI